ncbi:MAG: hypothetical protein L3K10_08415 [Thermoplasmata archaeon]|nr:hypothetical protein [Thermoplasmata archaeon]
MLRGSRSQEPNSVAEAYRGSTSSHEFLLAVAPLPNAPEFRISGWPQWLVPGHLSLSRAVRSRTNEPDDH